ncbi:MAG: GPI inositol-deacylase [Gammaproteobacteria bacterium]|nr:GPI inositol-deacylase [Gammaproteobacteria bacterium]
MAAQASDNPLKHLRASDIRGIAQLATQATQGVTGITEGVHRSVLSTIGFSGGNSAGQTRGLTGMVYTSIRVVTQLLGKGLDMSLAALQPMFDLLEGDKPETPKREAVLAVLNGVMGDRLVASDNSFAIPMSLRHRGQALDMQSLTPMPGVTSKVLLMIHGLCMSDLQWHAKHKTPGTDHGEALASGLGYKPIYVRYNTGLHVSQNGRELATQLEQLLSRWPTLVDEVSVVAHSMGGLVIRSALHYATEQAMRWPAYLKNIVFLGTPHHGAPLERVGNWLDALMGSSPYTKPFNALGQIRSAGITDLRYGHVLDDDWQGYDRFDLGTDQRQPLPLPEGVACYSVAATTAATRSTLVDRLLGDGLVPLNSALGQHAESDRTIAFAKDSQWIAYHTSHMELLSRPEVTRQIVRWLTPA